LLNNSIKLFSGQYIVPKEKSKVRTDTETCGSYHWFLVLRNARSGVKSNCVPDKLKSILIPLPFGRFANNPIASSVGTVHLEPFDGANKAYSWIDSNVMEDSSKSVSLSISFLEFGTFVREGESKDERTVRVVEYCGVGVVPSKIESFVN
jgi:hypothetical protein